MSNSNAQKHIEFSDKAILDIANKKAVSLPDLCNAFPDIDKTRIAHRIESLKKSKSLRRVTTISVNYYKAGLPAQFERA